ncbi:MAG: hypothetical protein QXI60_05315 [Thermofilaceae archaeon]
MAKSYRKESLPGKQKAKRRGIVGYRMVKVKDRPRTYVRVALVRKTGPRGGRTVATSKLERKSKRP